MVINEMKLFYKYLKYNDVILIYTTNMLNNISQIKLYIMAILLRELKVISLLL